MKHLTGERHDKAMKALAVDRIPTCELVTPQEIALLDESSLQEEDDA